MFTSSVDIANRALQHCGASRIATLADDDKGAAEIAQCYDGLRRAELRRNVWAFAVKRAVLYPVDTQMDDVAQGALNANNAQLQPTMLLNPPVWSATKQYLFGAIVAYNGQIYVCQAATSLNAPPGTADTFGKYDWDTYFGSMCVQPFDTTLQTSYYAGDLVYYQSLTNPGVVNVYASLANGNQTDPTAVTPYSATVMYTAGQVVQDAAGYYWISLINLNQGNTPGVYGFWSATPTYQPGAYVIGSDNVLYLCILAAHNLNPAAGANPTYWTAQGYPGSWPVWNTNDTYGLNELAAGADGRIYQSVKASNKGNDPTLATYNPNTPATNTWVPTRWLNPWTAYFASNTDGDTWLNLGATVQPLTINYPYGAGPSIQTMTKNAFMLPNGYLRQAPQDPKRGSVSFLGAPTGRMYEDWIIDGQFLISNSSDPIVFRFVADIQQVAKMDDMFCEGLAARIGLEVVETLTQSGSKKQQIEQDYSKFMMEARMVNGIEEDSVEPPEDDFITCRI